MKRKICLFFAFVFMLSALVSPSVLADDISLFDNNTCDTYTHFSVSDTGEARVMVNYNGYSAITTHASIVVKIEKRNLLVFWKDVVEEIYYCWDASYSNTFVYQLEKSGTYRCTVTYTISGIGGADDVITFQDTKTY